MPIVSCYVSLQKLRLSLGDKPQGLNGESAQLLDKTLQGFAQDFTTHPPKSDTKFKANATGGSCAALFFSVTKRRIAT